MSILASAAKHRMILIRDSRAAAVTEAYQKRQSHAYRRGSVYTRCRGQVQESAFLNPSELKPLKTYVTFGTGDYLVTDKWRVICDGDLSRICVDLSQWVRLPTRVSLSHFFFTLGHAHSRRLAPGKNNAKVDTILTKNVPFQGRFDLPSTMEWIATPTF